MNPAPATRRLPVAPIAPALLVALLLTALGPAAPAAEAPREPATISTSGHAELHVPADVADLAFEVSVRHADLATARKRQAERAARVLTALRAAGVADKDLQTSQVTVSATHAENRRTGAETATVSFYDVAQSVTVTLRDVKRVSEVTTDTLNAGATGVGTANSGMPKYADRS